MTHCDHLAEHSQSVYTDENQVISQNRRSMTISRKCFCCHCFYSGLFLGFSDGFLIGQMSNLVSLRKWIHKKTYQSDTRVQMCCKCVLSRDIGWSILFCGLELVKIQCFNQEKINILWNIHWFFRSQDWKRVILSVSLHNDTDTTHYCLEDRIYRDPGSTFCWWNQV